jgi:PPM family protein phosphatase
MKLTVKTYFSSDIGRRRANNEDYAGAYEPQDADGLARSGRLYVVADGLGGHEMGEKASQYAVEFLLAMYYKTPKLPVDVRLRNIIQQANQNLVAYARRNMGPGEKTATTLVAAVVRNHSLLVASVGDSRAYLLRKGEISQITRDHSLVGEMLRAGTLTETEAQQSRLQNRLTRSVGGVPDLEVDIHPPIALLPGDTILLCTDGLTRYATGRDLLTEASHGTPREITERLICFANERGGEDNITVAVIQVGGGDALPIFTKYRLPVLIGLGSLLLVILSLLSWSWFSGLGVFRRPTATLTPSPTSAPTVTPSPFPVTPRSRQSPPHLQPLHCESIVSTQSRQGTWRSALPNGSMPAWSRFFARTAARRISTFSKRAKFWLSKMFSAGYANVAGVFPVPPR